MAPKVGWHILRPAQRVQARYFSSLLTCSRLDRTPNPVVYNNASYQIRFFAAGGEAASAVKNPPHSLLPNVMLWRSLLIATISTHKLLLRPALAILSFFSKPREGFLSLENNFILRNIFKGTLYNHFCAGENPQEVKATIDNIKKMGFRGVILTYAAEVVIDKTAEEETRKGAIQPKNGANSGIPHEHSHDQAIEAWRDGVLKTVRMIGEGDYLALKFTGAGPTVANALETDVPIPEQMAQALEDVCNEALKRNCRVLIDAEQQFVQSGIDKVTMELMRKYNRTNQAIVFNTYQAYLKRTPQVLQNHLEEAQKEDFIIGVKLVRGAYLNSEPRHLINDSKDDTDTSYDTIARKLLQGQYPLSEQIDKPLPGLELFLATHNRASVLKAHKLQLVRKREGLPLTAVQYGQLLGMADGVSCTLLQLKNEPIHGDDSIIPEVFKCLSWGTLEECSSYLLRRAVENRDAVTRTEEEYYSLKKEAARRLIGNP